MTKDNKKIIISSILCLLPIIAGLLLWNRLPDKIPIHWGMDNTVNRYSSKSFGIIGVPLICCGSNLLAWFSIKLDPKNRNANTKVRSLMLWLLPAITIITQLTILAYALGYQVNVPKPIFILIGIMFIFIGNYLPKTQPNYTIGLKLPWTLHSDYNWQKTHRLAGILWIIGGLLIVVGAFFLSTEASPVLTWGFFGILSVMVIVPIIYSLILSRSE